MANKTPDNNTTMENTAKDGGNEKVSLDSSGQPQQKLLTSGDPTVENTYLYNELLF